MPSWKPRLVPPFHSLGGCDAWTLRRPDIAPWPHVSSTELRQIERPQPSYILTAGTCPTVATRSDQIVARLDDTAD